MSEERWVHIPELPYSISDHGRIYSDVSKKILSPGIDDTGYRRFSTRYKGKPVKFYVHRWVAWAFVYNWEPYSRLFVNHKDGNKLNNHYTNLEWVTLSENSLHAVRTGLTTVPSQERRRREVYEIRNNVIVHRYACAHDAARAIGCDYKKIDNICRRTPLRTEFSGSYWCFRDWLESQD